MVIYLGEVGGVRDDAEEVEREPAEAEGKRDGGEHHVRPARPENFFSVEVFTFTFSVVYR